MTVLLYDVPRTELHDEESIEYEIRRNFETEESIKALADHCRSFLPGLTTLNVADENWTGRLHGRRVLNYTYAFGLLDTSVRPTLLLEAAGADYLGARPAGLYLSANKPHVSDLMASLGFSCPRQQLVCGPLSPADAERLSRRLEPAEHLVLKPAYEESSIGLALLPNEPKALREAVNGLQRRLPCVALLQEYVDGVDVTVPVIGRSSPRCLPAVVLERDTWGSVPAVMDAATKATKATVHYASTAGWDGELQARIYAMAFAATEVAGLRDYSRLDCRVTPAGRCVFLEINANPQLGLGKASFAVSAGVIGKEVGEVVRAIVRDTPAALPGTVGR
ncbi:hypothetical protein O7599_35690 [Streptomyces sp. WMMC500]|uniref:hypothetical protein n=1 Tax=Streptomyces sp. WMMC500 TaxID=3015154 RepID=UPI00248CC834|nr:hypothetical protein [Streptomyces sp. WMMC500]WBB60778.1 hypothetical protein O7599_35690 [Streptomyces sp. WMMC500]